MSASPFPQLLRRSTFAACDPLISRVYTSTPSSIHHHGDWGTKYPIHRPRGPRYVTLSQLDAGKVLGSDWRSAETEARFVQIWGTGRINWRVEDDLPGYRSSLGHGVADDYALPRETAEREVGMMEDVNAMDPKTFEKYLDRVRRNRKEFLKSKLETMRERTKAMLVLPEDKTLVTLGTKKYVAEPETSVLQVNLAKSDLEAPGSLKLHSRPHRLHGLSYSRLSPASIPETHRQYLPGRALDKVSHLTAANERAVNFTARDGTNRPWVVGVGGVTAKSRTSTVRINDTPDISHGVDYTRDEPNRGEARWRVTEATIKQPPRVLSLAELSASNVSGKRGRSISAAKKMGPLETFEFDITVSHVSSSMEAEPEEQPGSREWVAREPRVSEASKKWDGDLGLGGPRSERRQGAGERQLKSWEFKAQREARDDSAARVNALLARLNKKT